MLLNFDSVIFLLRDLCICIVSKHESYIYVRCCGRGSSFGCCLVVSPVVVL